MVRQSFDGKLIQIVVEGIDEVAIDSVTAGKLVGEPSWTNPPFAGEALAR